MIHSIRNIPGRFSNSSGFGSFRGPQYRPQNTIVPIIGTPKRPKGTPNYGKPSFRSSRFRVGCAHARRLGPEGRPRPQCQTTCLDSRSEEVYGIISPP